MQKRWVYDYDLNSIDVDGDGFIETPTVITDIASMPENLKFMEWTSFLSAEPVRKFYGVCEADTGLYFPLPDEWQNFVELQYGPEEINWQVRKTEDDTVLVDFMLLPTGFDEKIDNNEVVVNIGALQVKIKFDESVSEPQRQYIADGIMYIK